MEVKKWENQINRKEKIDKTSEFKLDVRKREQ